MTIKYTNEGELVGDLIYGRGNDPRDTAPEPSLLPQLGAKLCHDFSINEVLDITRDIASHPSKGPPFTPLWEATLWGIARREDLADHLDDFDAISDEHWQIIRTLQTGNSAQALELTNAGVTVGSDYPDVAGIARLSPLLPRENTMQLLDPVTVNPVDFDSESLRSVLSAASAQNIDISDDWLDEALSDNWFGADQTSHLVHVLPNLPAARRTATADALAAQVLSMHLPPDQQALWISRIAPYVSAPSVWSFDDSLAGFSPLWRNHITQLQSSGQPTDPWGDVFRAHPAYRQIESVQRPHEVTAGAPHDILTRWNPPKMAAAEPERGRPPAAAAPIAPGPEEEIVAEPEAPRRLQANVSHEQSGKLVDAFVANEKHTIVVSIGRDGQVQANVDIEKKLHDLFANTDAESLELPVWFQFGKQLQEGSIVVPRNLREDSTTQSFALAAPADDRVVARIYVMRPDSELLLQSAILIGDVVPNLDDAVSHSNKMQLNVDILAGNLANPANSTSGRVLIADEDSGITRSEGKLIEVSLSDMKRQLGDLVSEIEHSADAQDFDDAKIAETLAYLAKGGRTLWKKYRRQLQELADSDYLQIVSTKDDFVLPLELVYDGPALKSSSTLCATWREALAENECPTCSGQDDGDQGNEPPFACPLNFWSVSKVIERRMADAKGGAFRVFGERSQNLPGLRTINNTVLAASSRVEPELVDELHTFATDDLQIGSQKTENWSDWVTAINSKKPELLVAMPHNGDLETSPNSILFLGEPEDEDDTPPDDTVLEAGQVEDEHVRATDSKPGPVVLLLGCDTQYQAGKLGGFSGEFRECGASLTVSTIGELRADQATLAAEVLMSKIMSDEFKGRGIGEAIREARRELLGKDLIMALLLVANGDAEWVLPS